MWNEKWRIFWTLAFGTERSSTSFIGKAMDLTNAPGSPRPTSRTLPERSVSFTNNIPIDPHPRTSRPAPCHAAVAERHTRRSNDLLGEGCTVMNVRTGN